MWVYPDFIAIQIRVSWSGSRSGQWYGSDQIRIRNIALYERHHFKLYILSGSTQVESTVCPAQCKICPQYRLGVRFVHARHLALEVVNKSTECQMMRVIKEQSSKRVSHLKHTFSTLGGGGLNSILFQLSFYYTSILYDIICTYVHEHLLF